jgi:hypothetical protein
MGKHSKATIKNQGEKRETGDWFPNRIHLTQVIPSHPKSTSCATSIKPGLEAVLRPRNKKGKAQGAQLKLIMLKDRCSLASPTLSLSTEGQ